MINSPRECQYWISFSSVKYSKLIEFNQPLKPLRRHSFSKINFLNIYSHLLTCRSVKPIFVHRHRISSSFSLSFQDSKAKNLAFLASSLLQFFDYSWAESMGNWISLNPLNFSRIIHHQGEFSTIGKDFSQLGNCPRSFRKSIFSHFCNELQFFLSVWHSFIKEFGRSLQPGYALAICTQNQFCWNLTNNLFKFKTLVDIFLTK